METCLAETGVSLYYWLFAAFLLIGMSGFGLRKGTKRGLFVSFMVGTLLLQIGVSPFTYAAASCPASAQPDVSTGSQGQVQSYNVLSNDQPSSGATFILSSLRLGIVSGSVLGTSISGDKKTILAPTEGVYFAQSDGIIRFTPELDFLGQAKGVNYFIDDTAGITSSSTYRPTVTSTLSACTNPESQGITLVNKLRNVSSTFVTNGRTITSKIDDTSPANWDGVSISSNGDDLILIGSGKPYTSDDGGITANKSNVPETLTWDALASSSDGQRAVAKVYDSDLGQQTLYTTSDGGVTWSQRLVSYVGSLRSLTSSPDGMVLAALNYTASDYKLQISIDGGVTWNLRDPGVTRGSYAISDDGNDIYVNDTTNNTLRISHDSGVTWSTQAITAVSDFSSMLEVSGDGNTLVMFAHTYGPINKTQIFISYNYGVTWVERTGPWGDSFIDTYDISNDLQTITVAAVDDATYTGHIYGTTNTGTTWTQLMPFADNIEWTSMVMTNDGNTLKAIVYNYDDNSSRLYSSNDAGANWTVVNTISDQAFTPQQVDIDLSLPGQQLAVDRTTTEGWMATYNPGTDDFTFTITDSVLFANSSVHQLDYSFIPNSGCQGPVGPGNIVIRTIGDGS